MDINKKINLSKILEVNTSNLKKECPLDEWYINLVNKTYHDLTYTDVARMFSQDIHKNIAILRAFDLLKDDPLCGMFDGQILEQISMQSVKELNAATDNILEMLNMIKTKLYEKDYDDIEDIQVYKNAIDNLLKKIKDI